MDQLLGPFGALIALSIAVPILWRVHEQAIARFITYLLDQNLSLRADNKELREAVRDLAVAVKRLADAEDDRKRAAG